MAGGTLLIRVMPEKGVFGPALASEVAGSASQVEGRSNKIGGLAGRALKIGAVAAVAGLGAGLVTAMNLEQAEVAFTQFLGSGQRAQRFIGDLKSFAAATPFELPGVIDQARNLLGVGVAANDVIPMLRDFGDATAAVGLGQEQFNNIMLQVRQGIGAGRFQLEELNAIADNGLPIFQMLSKALGKPVAELRNMASAGQLLSADVLPVLRQQMQKDYGGSLEAQSQTLAGLFSTLKDSIGLALADGVKPLIPVLKDVVPDAAETAGEAIGVLSSAFGLAFKVAGPLLKLAGDLAGAVTDLPGPIQAVGAAMIAWRLGGGQVSDMLAGLRDRARGAREEMALQQALLAAQQRDAALTGSAYGSLSTRMAATTAAGNALNTSASRVRIGLAALGGQGGVIGGVAGGLSQVVERYTAASAGASGFTGRLGAMTRAAGTAARVGLGGLVGALGGAWGIAIGAAVTGISLLVSANQRAAQAEAEHKARVESLSDAFRESNGLIDENIRRMQAKAAQDAGVFSAARSAGVDLADVTKAITGDSDALELVVGQLRRYAETQSIIVAGQSAGAPDVRIYTDQGKAAAEAADEIEGLAGDFTAGGNAAGEMAAALGLTTDATTDATAALSPMGRAMAAYAAATGDAKAQSDALKQALDALNGVHLTTLEAQAAVNGAMDDFAEKMANTSNELVQGNGEIDTRTEKGRELQASTLAVRDAMASAAQAARDEAIANGDSAGAAAAAGAAAQKVRDDFIAAAEASGLGHDAAVALADAYGLVPGSVVTTITTPGMTPAQAAADILRGKVLDIPDAKTVHTSALTADAIGTLRALGIKVDELPDGTVNVTADTGQANRTIQEFVNRQRVMRIRAQVDAPAASIPGVQRFGAAEGARLSFFAGGGVHGPRLTPMSGAWAREVPANTWRVVGDRPRGREWFIPEHAPNTLPLLADAAAAHGLQLVRAMAEGGLLGGRPTIEIPAPAPGLTVRQEIHPAAGMDETALANRVVRRIQSAARSGGRR